MAEVKALSALDLAFFVLESRERMSNVAPLAILRPPERTRSAAAFADRLLRAMRKHAVESPFNLRYRAPGLRGLPRLESVAAVDMAYHCHRHTLPAKSSDAQLFEFVCRLHEKRLDRSRPHWELHVIDGLADGRVALYFKVHHGLIDGRGFVDLIRRWFSTEATDRQVRAPWNVLPASKPRPPKPSAALHVSAVASRLTEAGRSLLSLYAALGRQALASAGLARGTPLPFLGTPGALCAKPSVQRSFAYCVLPLARLKAFGKEHDATVNDVLLTVLDMAMNSYLVERGRKLTDAPLVADMPVALGSGEGGGNSIAVLQFPLGAAATNARERLAQVMRRTADLKEHVRRTDASALMIYTAAVHGIPALMEALRVPRAPMLATSVISNPFGMPQRLYLGGAELEMVLPLSMLAPGQSLNITAVTYDQGLQIGFLGLAAELPDIRKLADDTVAAFDELTASTQRSTARRRTPAAPRKATALATGRP